MQVACISGTSESSSGIPFQTSCLGAGGRFSQTGLNYRCTMPDGRVLETQIKEMYDCCGPAPVSITSSKAPLIVFGSIAVLGLWLGLR